MITNEEGFPNFEKLIEAAPESSTPLAVVPSVDMIPITCESGKASVDARDLHAFLEVGKDFSNWIKDRIQQFGFVEGQDFSPNLAESTGGRPSKEYTLSMDMAKELSMVERTDKGKQARQYFIACEKRMLEGQQSFQLPTTLAEALEFAAGLARDKEKAVEQLAIAAPKVEFYDRVTQSATDCSMATAAQLCKLPYGQNRLFQKLREMGVLISGGSRHNQPKQVYIEQGLFNVHEGSYIKDNEVVATFTTTVTQKGLAWIIKNLGKTKAA